MASLPSRPIAVSWPFSFWFELEILLKGCPDQHLFWGLISCLLSGHSCCWLGAGLIFSLIILCKWSPNCKLDELQKIILQLVDCLELECIFLGVQCHNWWLGSRSTAHICCICCVAKLLSREENGLWSQIGLGEFWLCHSYRGDLGKVI